MAGIELVVRVILRNKVCSFHLLLRVVVAPEEQRGDVWDVVCSTEVCKEYFPPLLMGQNKTHSLFSPGFAAVSAPGDILVRGDNAAPHLPKD